jgi:hypothetical protein
MSKPPETLTHVGRILEDAIADLMKHGASGQDELTRFGALTTLRDYLIAVINNERPQEIARLKDVAATLKKALAGTTKGLRDVSTVTKPRGPRKSKAATTEKEKDLAAV